MTTDATQVTGSPLAGHEVARRGDVLAERYELLEVPDIDGPSIGYRAVDQETERSVLVRVLAGPGLPERTLGEVLERLRALVGVGGRYLSSLLDADREGKQPFTVEAWPAGTPLSAIFASRRTREETLGPSEVLPLVARIAAGLAAIPEPWHHGDVRAERVWVDTDGVRLTGAFLLAALPLPALRERIEALGPGALAYAPEVAAARLAASADRWGLAAITWEALTGRAPELASHPPELSTPLRAALLRLLDPEPGRRAKDVSALLEALAEHAGMVVPDIDPEPHRPPGDVGRPPRSVPPPVRRRIEGAAEEGTQEITFDQILAGRTIESDDDALDPDLVAAALADDTARQAPVSHETSAPDLDPRLVRAALGVTSEESSLGPIDTPPPRPAPARRRSQNDIEQGLPRPPAGGGRGEGAVTTGPTDTPPPRPSPASGGGSSGRDAATGRDGATAIVPRPVEEPAHAPPARRSRLAGPLIVVTALLLAVAIVGLGFFIRAQMTEKERAREIQERLEQIRSADPGA